MASKTASAMYTVIGTEYGSTFVSTNNRLKRLVLLEKKFNQEWFLLKSQALYKKSRLQQIKEIYLEDKLEFINILKINLKLLNVQASLSSF